jgi:membrane-bound ClpP family serine protease
MDQKMWAGRTLLKYALIQLPAIAALVLILVLVKEWMVLPAWFTWGLVGLWVAKDLILYPFVWRAYEWGPEKGKASMIGLCGVAKDRLNPSGYVFVRGELWKARVIDSGVIEMGENVVVKGSNGLTLLVKQNTEDISAERS